MESVNFEDMRRAMVDSQLRTSGVTDAWVLAAMGRLPREYFVPAAHRSTAYMDRSIMLDDGSALNPAVSTALMLQAAEVSPEDHILLIGADNGYVAAVLRERGASLVCVDASNLSGATTSSPYTLIIIDGAVEELPDALLALAADGARLITGLAEGAVTRLAKGYVRDQKVALKPFIDSEIAPLAAFARKPEFVF
jgi:protein-L-isoaspartate(D-aspartate) O-methyltransferase